MSTPAGPTDYPAPQAIGSDPAPPTEPGSPVTPADALDPLAPPAPAAARPTHPSTPTPPRRPVGLAWVPIIIGLIGLLITTALVADLSQGQAAESLILAWLGIVVVVIFRLAQLWQHKLNDRPFIRRSGP